MTLTDYKRKANSIAKQDSRAGFCFHVLRNPFSDGICELIEKMASDGFNKTDRDEIEAVWESSLVPMPKFNGWGNL